MARAKTVSTDTNPCPVHTHPETEMRKSILILKSLLLSALLATTAFAAQKVNINSADAATLDRVLVGIGPSKAEAIVAYRKANGAFRSPDQLASVKGIGLATIEKNRDRILVGGGAPAAPAKAGTAAKSAAPRPAAKAAAKPTAR